MATIIPGHDSHWRTLTKCCQGTTYEARYLEPDTDYVFRVRSENIFGVGKPSHPSDICTTKIYETFPVDFRSSAVSHNSLDESGHVIKRHYSFNMHIGKGVQSILNHSEINLESTVSSRSSSASITDKSKTPHTFLRSNILRTSLPSSRKISAPLLLPGTRNNSLNRLRDSRKCGARTDNSHKTSTRDSGISGLRESLTVFDSNSVNSESSVEDGDKKIQDFRSHRLPSHTRTVYAGSIDGDSGKGSRSSLCDSMKISDSQSISDSVVTDVAVSDRKSVTASSRSSNMDSCETINMLSDIDENTDFNKTKGLGKIDENSDICKINALGCIDDNSAMYTSQEKLKAVDFTDSMKKPSNNNEIEFPKGSRALGYYDTLENPWQTAPSVSGVSEQILAAPVSDDMKMALYSKNLPRSHFVSGSGRSITGLPTKEAADFRKLRSVLQSHNVIMKNSRSLPDVVAIVTVNGETQTVIKGKLTTLLNTGINDDDDAVRITTL